jgi:murein DD-endopeptidase MepM/ murein hydrolase activator NlpD
MKKIFQNIIHISLIICLIIVNLYIPDVKASESTTLRQLKEELAAFEQDYNDNKLQQQLTEEERENTKSNIKNIETTISNTQDEIYNLKLEIEQLNKDIIEKEEQIDSLLSYYQISNGESTYLEYAFGASNFTDFIYRVAISEQLTSYNNSLVEQYKQSIEDSNKKTEQLTVKISDLEKQQSNLETQLVKLADDLNELYDDALDIENQIKLAKSTVQMYEDMGCNLDEDLEACVKRNLITDTEFKRPLQTGYLTSFPGARVIDGISGTIHHGLDMSNSGAAYTDYPVYPIANGKVVAILYNSSCGGRMIYIEHNVNGTLYTSAYWHLRRIDVSAGDVVTFNTQIGIMGGTESEDKCTTGAHLHLELSLAKISSSTNVISAARASWLYPQKYVNFPKSLYETWTNRTRRY